jgi:hypothetical protein
MKKALVCILVLVVAGGLFAQQLSFSGLVNGGVGLFKAVGDDDPDPVYGLIAKNQEGNGVRAQLNVIGTNADGNAGVDIRIRAVGGGNGGSFRDDFQFRHAYGWVSFVDNMLRVQGGRMNGNDFNTLDPITDGATLFDSYGLLSYINPVDTVKIGVGAYTPQRLGEGLPIDDVSGYVGLGVNLPNLLNFRAQLSSKKDDVKALASARIAVLKDIPIEATARLTGLSEFSDSGTMSFYERFGFNAISNLSLNLALAQSLSQADDTDMFFRGWFWLTYSLGNIVPRLDVNYITGGKFNTGVGLGVNASYNDGYNGGAYTYDKDQAYLTVSPSVQFRAAANTFVELGYLFGKDMSDNDKAAIGAKNGGINHAAFADVRVSF